MNCHINVTTLLMLAMLLGSSSCSVVSGEVAGEIYPIAWNGLSSENQGCNLVDGVYENIGKSSNLTPSYPITLDGSVFGRMPRRGGQRRLLVYFF